MYYEKVDELEHCGDVCAFYIKLLKDKMDKYYYYCEVENYYKRAKSPSAMVKLGDFYIYSLSNGIGQDNYRKAKKLYKEVELKDPLLAREKIEILDSIYKAYYKPSEYIEGLGIHKGVKSGYASTVVDELMGERPVRLVKVIENVTEFPKDKINPDIYGAVLIKSNLNNTKKNHTIYKIDDYIRCINMLNVELEHISDVKKDKSNESEVFSSICWQISKLATPEFCDYDDPNEFYRFTGKSIRGSMLRLSEKISSSETQDCNVYDNPNEFYRYASENLIGPLHGKKSSCSAYCETLRNALALKGIESTFIGEKGANREPIKNISYSYLQVKLNGEWHLLELALDQDNCEKGTSPLSYSVLNEDIFFSTTQRDGKVAYNNYNSNHSNQTSGLIPAEEENHKKK